MGMRRLLWITCMVALLTAHLYAQFRPLPKPADLPKLREQATSGDALALYQLAICHIEEIGVDMDYLEARELLGKAAAKGDGPAMAMLSFLEMGAPGIARNRESALGWAKKALETGHPSGHIAMALFHLNGFGTPKSEEQAVRLLRKVMDSEPEAMVIMARLHLGASATLKNEREGFRLLNIAASKGNRAAQSFLARCYAQGIGTKQDIENAMSFAERARKAGSIEGANILAQLALDEAPPATDKALELLAKGLRHQDPRSCYIMGSIYLNGIGMAQSYFDACRLLRISAEKGDSYGLLAYASTCFHGRGRSSDEVLGLACMIASSMMGNDDAQRYLDNFRQGDRQGAAFLRATAIAQSIHRQLQEGDAPAELQENWHSALFDGKGIISPTPRRGRGIATGSGMIFTKEGHCFTNHHVIEGARTLKVRVPGHKDTINATLIASDESNDLAILKIEGWAPAGELPVIVSCAAVRSGDKAFTVGYPLPSQLGQEAKFTSGDISALSGLDEDRRLMQISVPVQPGNSGGPLALEDGRVMGIVVSSLNASYMLRKRGVLPQNVNFAIKSDYLIALAGTCGIQVPADRGTAKDPVETIKANSVQVIAEN